MSIRTFQFFKNGRFSSLVRMIKFYLLAMSGDRKAGRIVQQIWDETQHELNYPAIDTIRQFLLSQVQKKAWNERMYPYLKDHQSTGLSYKDFDLDPAPVSQVKSIINACDLAFELLKTLEELDIEHLLTFSDQNSLVKTYHQVSILKMIDYVYELSKLVAHTDIDLGESFAAEWKMLKIFFHQLSAGLFSFYQDTDQLLDKFEMDLSSPTQIAEQVGLLVGRGVDQLGKSNRCIDYPFLTQLSAALPSYLDQFSQYLKQYIDAQEGGLPIEESKYSTLENNALVLLHSLENITLKGLLYPQFPLDFYHILRNSHILIRDILHEVNQLNEPSQTLIKAHLEKLKFNLAGLMALTDKIEEEGVTTPGILSNPTFQKISPMYDQLIHMLSRIVDFSVVGSHLTSLNDVIFVQARADYTFQRRAERLYEQSLLEAQLSQVHAFFNLIRQHEGKAFTVLDEEIQSSLRTHYQKIHTLIENLDQKIDQKMVALLTGESIFHQYGADWISHWNMRLVEEVDESFNETHYISHILKLQPLIEKLIKKKQHTLDFYLAVNQDILQGIYRQSDHLILENAPKKWQLQPKEGDLIQVYASHASQYQHIIEAQAAFKTFSAMISERRAEPFTLSEKQSLRNLYGIFQPALITAGLIVENQGLVQILSEKSQKSLTEEFSSCRAKIALVLQAVHQEFQIFLKENKEEAVQKSLEQIPAQNILEYQPKNRSTFLIKQSGVAALMQDVQQKMPQFFKLFQQEIQEKVALKNKDFLMHMQEVLTFSLNKIPYPHIIDPIKALSEPRQVLWLMRLANSVAHFEEAAMQLELLNQFQVEGEHSLIYFNNLRLKMIFSSRIFKTEHHIREGVWSAQDLMNDAHLSIFYKGFLQEIKPFNERIKALKQFYSVQGEYNSHKTYDLVSFMINALLVTPKFSADVHSFEIQKIRQDARRLTQEIYRIIDNTPFYLKLFLEIPAVIQLVIQFKEKIEQFSFSTHQGVIHYLNEVEKEIFIPLLSMADAYEEYFLVTGQLTPQLESFLDAIFKGLLEALRIGSNQYISLRMHEGRIQQRLLLTQERMKVQDVRVETLNKSKQKVEALISLYPMQSLFNESSQFIFIREINACLSLLKEARPACIFAYRHHAHEQVIDHLLNDKLIQPNLKNFNHDLFKALLKVYLCYLDGEMKSYVLAQKSCENQKQYLQNQLTQQSAKDAEILYTYIKEKLTVFASPYKSIYVQLIHAGQLYNQALNDYIKAVTPEIQEAISLDRDINQQIKENLARKIHLFQGKNLVHYQQLEKVMCAMHQLRHYLGVQYGPKNASNYWNFETEETLGNKKSLLIELEKIIQQNPLTVQERVSKIALVIQRPNFKKTLLDYHEYEAYSFKWLIQCVIEFLTFLEIYKPERQKVYDAFAHNVQLSSHSFFTVSTFDMKKEPLQEENTLLLPRKI